jgi:hypothetical protein
MFRMWKKAAIFARQAAPAAKAEPSPFDNLPFIDNETLDQFLADPVNIELLPVDPSDYSPEIQRMVVSAFLHEASTSAKPIEVH